MKKIAVISLTALFLSFNTAFAQATEYVKYNPQSGIYHKSNCPSAKSCKKCITIDKKIAIKKGGRACKRCGG